MKILVVSQTYPPPSKMEKRWQGGRGGERVIKTIVDELASKGHKVTVISGFFAKGLKKPNMEKFDGSKVVWLPLYVPLESLFKFVSLKMAMPPTLDAVMYLKKNIDFDEYDVIHFFAFPSLIVDYVNFMSKNTNKLLTVHGLPQYFEREGKAHPLLKFLYKVYFHTLARKAIEDSKIVTAVSRSTFEVLVQKNIPQEKVKIINNGIHLDKHKKINYKQFVEEFSIEERDTVILTVSRIVWHKGLEYAIEAIHKISKIREQHLKYVIVGCVEDPVYFSNLQKLISDSGLGKKITFTGFVDDHLKLQALSRADIFLAPSLFEGFGLTILEAMASAKPIIATKTTGFRDILKHGKTALMVNPKSSSEIADSIISLLSNASLRNNLAKNANRDARRYDWRPIIEEYEELYNEITSKRHI